MSNENNIAPINEDLNVVKYEVDEAKIWGHNLWPQVQQKNIEKGINAKKYETTCWKK